MVVDGGHRREQPFRRDPGGAVRHDPGQEVDRRRGARHQLVGQGAQLEPLGTSSVEGSSLSGRSVSAGRLGRPAPRSAARGTCTASRRRSRRPARRRRSARGRCSAPHRRRRSAPTAWARAAIARDVGPGAEQVGRRGDGDQPGPVGEHVGDVVRGRARRSRDRTRPSARSPRRAAAAIDPGPDVRVVVEPGHDDLVAWRPARGQRAGEVEGERGHAAAEDDAAGVERRAGRPSRAGRPARRRRRPVRRR